MKMSGNKETFALEYGLVEIDPKELNDETKDWGCVKFWVNGRNLFAMKDNKPAETYHWYLGYLVRWFSEGLDFIMDEKDTLLDSEAETSFILLDRFYKILDQYDFGTDEHADLNDLRLEWNEHHNIVFADERSWLPYMYIRAVRGKIEICWDNSGLFEDREVKPLYTAGLEYVERKDFIKPVIEFIRDYVKIFENESEEFIDFFTKIKDSLKVIVDKHKLEFNL